VFFELHKFAFIIIPIKTIFTASLIRVIDYSRKNDIYCQNIYEPHFAPNVPMSMMQRKRHWDAHRYKMLACGFVGSRKTKCFSFGT
jgi:hypothetical protein